MGLVLNQERAVQECVLRRIKVQSFQPGHGHIQVTAGHGGIVVRSASQGPVCKKADVDGTAGLLRHICHELFQSHSRRTIGRIGCSQIDVKSLILRCSCIG